MEGTCIIYIFSTNYWFFRCSLKLRKYSEAFLKCSEISGWSGPMKNWESSEVFGLVNSWAVWPLTTIFGVLGCSWLFWGCSGVLWGVPGVFRGCSGVFWGCSGNVPGCSGGVPGFTDTRSWQCQNSQWSTCARWNAPLICRLPHTSNLNVMQTNRFSHFFAIRVCYKWIHPKL